MKSIIEDRIKQLSQAAQSNIQNHQMLLGQIAEATHLLQVLFPAAAPIIEGVEEVAKVVESVAKGESHAIS